MGVSSSDLGKSYIFEGVKATKKSRRAKTDFKEIEKVWELKQARKKRTTYNGNMLLIKNWIERVIQKQLSYIAVNKGFVMDEVIASINLLQEEYNALPVEHQELLKEPMDRIAAYKGNPNLFKEDFRGLRQIVDIIKHGGTDVKKIDYKPNEAYTNEK